MLNQVQQSFIGADGKGPRAACEDGGKGKESDNPPEDAVWGLDITREHPTNVMSDPTAVYKVCLYIDRPI